MFGIDDLAIAGMALGGVSSIANFGLGLANYNYQKGLQQTMFNREDNSIARRVADLKASGMSPVLAAGQGASAGPVVATKAPELEGLSDSALIYANLIGMSKDFAIKDQTLRNLRAQESMLKLNTMIRDLDYYYYNETGISPSSSAIGKTIRDLLIGYSKFKSETGAGVEKVIDDIRKKIPYKSNPYKNHDLSPEGFEKSKPPKG